MSVKGYCPYCAASVSTVVREGEAYARCSHRECGARGPTMPDEARAIDIFVRRTFVRLERDER